MIDSEVFFLKLEEAINIQKTQKNIVPFDTFDRKISIVTYNLQPSMLAPYSSCKSSRDRINFATNHKPTDAPLGRNVTDNNENLPRAIT